GRPRPKRRPGARGALGRIFLDAGRLTEWDMGTPFSLFRCGASGASVRGTRQCTVRLHQQPEDEPMSVLALPQPAAELIAILLPAFAPCQGFNGECNDCMWWNPQRGRIPRGFCGACGFIRDVRLILV